MSNHLHVIDDQVPAIIDDNHLGTTIRMQSAKTDLSRLKNDRPYAAVPFRRAKQLRFRSIARLVRLSG